ncbi:MAG: hypothetical protein IJW48_04815 [Clostridia bacterium]|nr:hypothetical protein [Clostridia bacterium]
MDENERIEEVTEKLKETVENSEELTEAEKNFTEEEDSELEYDEEGNVVIPDDEESGDESNAEEPTTDETNEGGAEDAQEPTADNDELRARNGELEREISRIKAQARETLAKYGIEAEDEVDGLERMAAEADGTTREEYVAAREAKRIADEKQYADDLAALKAEYPEALNYGSIHELPNLKRFAELRVLGLSASEAYAASHSKEMRKNVAQSVKRQTSGKEHLRSVVPKGSSGRTLNISRDEMESLRELFPGKSDKEIIKLYKETL